jgi:hypothetical protein
MIQYTVVQGDCLSFIATAYGLKMGCPLEPAGEFNAAATVRIARQVSEAQTASMTDGLRGIIGSLVWFVYFRMSKRVRFTYWPEPLTNVESYCFSLLAPVVILAHKRAYVDAFKLEISPR